MTRLDYLKSALHMKLYYNKEWFIRCFAVTKTTDSNNNTPWQIIKEPWGYSCNTNGQKEPIEDTDSSKPLFSFLDPVTIDPSWVPNVKEPTETYVGNVLFNSVCILSSMGPKFPFITGRVNISKIENYIAPLLNDTPEDESQRDPNKYYVDEYVKFVNALQFISSLSQLTAWSATPKSLMAPTGLKEFKAELLEKYKGKLTDPVELSKFDNELLAFDDAFLKDDPSYGKFLTGKIVNTARKKMYLSIGADKSFTDSVDVVPVTNSLQDGWPTDPDEFVALMNSLRVGSYSRGAETVKGGVSAKVLLRAGNNYTIKDTDCNVTYGITRLYRKANIDKLIGRYVINNKIPLLIDSEEKANSFIDKSIMVRSPMYCKLEGPNLCRVCAGENLFKFPTGVTIPLTEISGIILNTNLKAMHSNVLTTATLSLAEHFS